MGRKKIKIQPLPESQIRAKFKKRKVGLVKKASELGTLCGAQVALIIFSKDGEEVIDKGYNATTLEIIQRFEREVLRCRDPSGLPQQQIAALQAQQFQPNPDSSTQGILMDPNMQQAEVAMDPPVQQEQYTNPQVQHEQYMNQQVQQEQYMNQQVQQEVPIDSNMQHILYVNPHRQQEVSTVPCMQQDQYGMSPHRQQEVSTDRLMQQDFYVNPHRQQSMTGISQMQQGMQYTGSMGTNFIGTSNYMQDMAEGNQQFHAQRHPTQFQNQTNVRYNDRQPSEPGFHT